MTTPAPPPEVGRRLSVRLGVGWAIVALGAESSLLGAGALAAVPVGIGLLLLSLGLVQWRRWGRPRLDLTPTWTIVLGVSALVLMLGVFDPRVSATSPLVSAALAATCAAGVVALHRGGRWAVTALAAAWGVAAACWAATMHHQPALLSDVAFFVQQAAEATASFSNPYQVDFTYPDLLVDAVDEVAIWGYPYPYGPSSTIVLAPFQTILGEARWANVVAIALLPGLLRLVVPWRDALLAGLVVIVIPGSMFVARSWPIEPLIVVLVVATVVAAERRWTGASVVLGAMLATTKQFALIPLAVLATWATFGWRRAAVTVGLAALVVAPFVLTAPGEFIEGTVTGHLEIAPRVDAVSFGGFATALGVPWPSWVALLLLAGYVAAVFRPPRSAGETVLLSGLMSAAAFMSFSHAFFNYYWLVLALIPAGLALGLSSDSSHRLEPDGRHAHKGKSMPMT